MKINIDTVQGAEGDLLVRGPNGRYSPKAPSAMTPTSWNVVTADALNTAVTRGLTLSHTTTNTAQAGIGAGLLFRAESGAGTLRSAGAVDAIHTTVTDGAETSAVLVSAGIAGSLLEVARFAAVASAVNGFAFTGAATAGTPTLSARGSDSNIGIALQAKGTGAAALASGNGAVTLGVSNSRVEMVGSTLHVETDTQTGASPTVSLPAGVVRVASGATSVTVTNTLVTANSLVFAAIRNTLTNNVAIRSVVPGSGSFVITLSGDPGASHADIAFFVVNPAT